MYTYFLKPYMYMYVYIYIYIYIYIYKALLIHKEFEAVLHQEQTQ